MYMYKCTNTSTQYNILTGPDWNVCVVGLRVGAKPGERTRMEWWTASQGLEWWTNVNRWPSVGASSAGKSLFVCACVCPRARVCVCVRATVCAWVCRCVLAISLCLLKCLCTIVCRCVFWVSDLFTFTILKNSVPRAGWPLLFCFTISVENILLYDLFVHTICCRNNTVSTCESREYNITLLWCIFIHMNQLFHILSNNMNIGASNSDSTRRDVEYSEAKD